MEKGVDILRNYNFMIVDDHAYVRSMLQGVMGRFGQSSAVTSGSIKDAMETFRLLKTNPGKVGVTNLDIIFVDYRLSGEEGNGWDLVKSIRRSSDSFNRFVRVIGITAFADVDVLKSGRDAGANAVIAKPFNGRTIYNQVLDTINDNRPFVEYEDGSYFGPERYDNRKPMDRDEKGEFLSGVKMMSVKKISQKLGGDKEVLEDGDIFESIDGNIFEGAMDSREELRELVSEMQVRHRDYKGCGTEGERSKAMGFLGQAAHAVRDSDGMFLYPVVGKVAAYVERLTTLKGVTEHKHTGKILEGLLGLQLLLLSENKGVSQDEMVGTILKELEKLMKVIARSLSPEAEEFLFVGGG